jgi:predicted aspartyl protease
VQGACYAIEVLTARIASIALYATLVLVTAAPAAPAAPATPFTLFDNRIILPVTLDGRPGFSMIFDTGGTGLLVTPQAAARLGLKMKPAGTIGGAGAGRIPFWKTAVRAVTVDGVQLGRMPAIVANLDAIRHAIGFPHLDGVIGYDLFARYAVRIDVDTRTFAIVDASQPSQAFGRRVPFRVRSGFIEVPATIDGIDANVMLDTGDRSSLTLFEPFARKYGFYAVTPALRGVRTGYGIGGPIDGDVFRTALSVFGYSVPGVLTRAPLGNAGGFDSALESGSIGNGFLTRFNVVYDQPRRALFVSPSRRFAARDVWKPCCQRPPEGRHSSKA